MTVIRPKLILVVLLVAFSVSTQASQLIAPPVSCEGTAVPPSGISDDERRIACTVPEPYRFDVTVSEAIGKDIRRHDMAAWLTTDALREAGAFESIPGEGRGWLTADVEGGVWASYFSESDGKLGVFAEATLYWEPFEVRDVRILTAPRPATHAERLRLAAKANASSQTFLRCTDASYNSVVFEAEEENENRILVFLMPPMEDLNFPLGGYHMYRMSADGSDVVDHFAQTRGCLNASPDRLREVDAITLSHSMSATPTMFHVFMSLQYRKPFVVLTTQNGLLWKIEHGNIKELRHDDPMYQSTRDWADSLDIPHEPLPTSSKIG